MRFGLKESVITQINTIFAQFACVEKVLIYGSRAKGLPRPGSDIDLTMLGENITYDNLLKISLLLDDLLLPYSFDLSIYKQIDNPALLEHIKRVGAVFYRRLDLGQSNQPI